MITIVFKTMNQASNLTWLKLWWWRMKNEDLDYDNDDDDDLDFSNDIGD